MPALASSDSGVHRLPPPCFSDFGVLPGLGAGLAGIGDEIEFPYRLAGLELEGADPVLGAEIGAGGPGDDQVVIDQRRHREILTAGRAGDRLAPQQRAVGHVERDEIAVGRAAHELAVLDGRAAIGGRDLLALGLPDIGPALAAGLRVDRDGGAPEGEIHHAAVDERARLHRGRLLGAIEANRTQILGIGGRDLVEVDEAGAGIIVRSVKPVVGRGRRSVELGLGGAVIFGAAGRLGLASARRVFERGEIGEEVGPSRLVGHHDRHRRARHELGRVCQELDEGLGVPGQS